MMYPRTLRLLLFSAVLSDVVAFSILPVTSTMRRGTANNKNVLHQPPAAAPALFMAEGGDEEANPEGLNELMGNPAVMALLQSPKMQEAMQMMATGGPKALEEAVKQDPELQEVVEKLNEIMGMPSDKEY